ncbi:response regulator [Cellvibrio japonicus]|uniref:Response regulator (Activator) in two-component regulatory system with RstB (OmpR family) n=1 Tax=Cellvibrio japonicus (strain Ueda107) TaxID=498211 RepID=B3PFC1_CELJU|nr:response regulator [Cellvibrio japonicus]ACE84615.1 response regulator (activator) in two-component regulatory system with RstB (OmpR family) [Cellvibrio japonicus Ueda107]QEI10796.1 response regulator [Cellvibrio japonicus]QEI14372.1 response regulator [Cellvibrio japonicus]QEI17950.1 response regulator [Cellvibrio japonicus]
MLHRNILLVEDDRRLAQLVSDFLTANDFRVDVEENGNRVLRQVQNLNPSLVILDLMLPGKDGLTLCKELRPQYKGPILMLTARDSDLDQVLGLEYGADDYVIKPAEPRVLLARIRALLRRYYQSDENTLANINFGQLHIQPSLRKVTLATEEVHLSSHEFDLLLTLAASAGNILSRDFLFQQIYNREYDGLDRTIDVRISQLRKKLQDDPNNPTRIKTIWGKGYLFIADAWN